MFGWSERQGERLRKRTTRASTFAETEVRSKKLIERERENASDCERERVRKSWESWQGVVMWARPTDHHMGGDR